MVSPEPERTPPSPMSAPPAPTAAGPLDEVAVAELEPSVWQVTIVRPGKRNALSIAVRDAMSDALDGLARREDLKVVVITGAPPTFSAGFDLQEFDAANADEELNRRIWASSDRWHETLRTFPLPLVASVNGPALAGGFDLATMCDIRICGESAVFGRPEVGFAAPIYSIVRDLVGGAIARELAFTDRRFDAHEAMRMGLANAVVPDGDLGEATREWTRRIASAPAEGLRRSKAVAIAGAKYPLAAELVW